MRGTFKLVEPMPEVPTDDIRVSKSTDVVLETTNELRDVRYVYVWWRHEHQRYSFSVQYRSTEGALSNFEVRTDEASAFARPLFEDIPPKQFIKMILETDVGVLGLSLLIGRSRK